VQKGIKQALSNLPTPTTMDAKASNNKEVMEKVIEQGKQTCLSYELLRTPAASEAERGHQPASKAKARGGQQTLTGQFMEMFPTPKALDGIKGSLKTSAERESDGRQVDLPNVARDIILPTPTTNGNDRKGPNYQSAGILQELEIANGILPKEYKDWDHAKEKVKWAEPIEGQEKTKLDNETNWGKFEPAIRRWEATIGRPAPAPTKPDGKDGNHRLSSAFTEWMMGLPEGWITDVGLSRNEELKACGNGVVPQQAELALRVLLDGLSNLSSDLPILPTVMANSPMRNSRRAMVTHPTKKSSVALNQAIELMQGQLPAEFESWDEVPDGYKDAHVNLPTPTVSDTFTDNLKSSQQKPGSMHSVTLPQAVKWVADEH